MDEFEQRWQDVDRYFIDKLVHEDPALVQTRESPATHDIPQIDVAPNQAAFLSLITRISGAKRVLEFGTLVGYSAIWFARAVGPDGHVVTLELSEKHAEVARENFASAGVADNVEVLVGPAAESAQRLIDTSAEPFDLVFIDADKPSNPVYLNAALQLSRPGTVIIVDNVVRRGAVADPDSDNVDAHGVRAMTDLIADSPRLTATSVQTVGLKGWDGFTIALVS